MDSVNLFIAVLWLVFCVFAFFVVLSLLVVIIVLKDKRITDVVLLSYCCVLLLRVAITVPVESALYLAILELTKPRCQALLWWQFSIQIVDGLHIIGFAIIQILDIKVPQLTSSTLFRAHGVGLSILVWFLGHCATVPIAFIMTVNKFEQTMNSRFGPNDICFFEEIGQHLQWNIFVFVFSCFIIVLSIIGAVDILKCWQALSFLKKNEETQVKTIDSISDVSSHQAQASTSMNTNGGCHRRSWGEEVAEINYEYHANCLLLTVVIVCIMFGPLPNAVFAIVNIASLQSLHYTRFSQIWLLVAKAIFVPLMVEAASTKYRRTSRYILDCICCGLRASSTASGKRESRVMIIENTDQTTTQLSSASGQHHVTKLDGITIIVDEKGESNTDGIVQRRSTDDESGFDENASSSCKASSHKSSVESAFENMPNGDSGASDHLSRTNKLYFSGLKSRAKWKEHMQKQQLPATFMNKGFQEDAAPESHIDGTCTYISGAYHPDCIVHIDEQNVRRCSVHDSHDASGCLANRGSKRNSIQLSNSECETGSDLYDEADIDAALDRLSLITDISSDSIESEIEFGNQLSPVHAGKMHRLNEIRNENEINPTERPLSRLSQREQTELFANSVRELEMAIKCEATSEDVVKRKMAENKPDVRNSNTFSTIDQNISTNVKEVTDVKNNGNSPVNSNNVGVAASDEETSWPPLPTAFELNGTENMPATGETQVVDHLSNGFYFEGIDEKPQAETMPQNVQESPLLGDNTESGTKNASTIGDISPPINMSPPRLDSHSQTVVITIHKNGSISPSVESKSYPAFTTFKSQDEGSSSLLVNENSGQNNADVINTSL